MKRIGSVLIALAVLPLLAFGPEKPPAPTHWAVIIGISDYIHFDDAVGGDLPGAENDALAMRNVLVTRWGYPEENILMLLNGEATRDAIQAALTEWLPSVASPGDEVLVYFAGHGSQTWDLDGDEDDGLDETLAPADARAETAEFDITDDELNRWLLALPTNSIVTLDNCNSGTGTRDVTPFSRTRQLARELDALPRPQGVSRRALPGQVDERAYDSDNSRILELAAAQPYQAAVDAYFPGEEGREGFYGGAFTTFLVRELWTASPQDTFEEVFLRVREDLKRNRFEQDPYLSEESERRRWPLFSPDGTPVGVAGARFPIRSVEGSVAELSAGAVAGITPRTLLVTEGGGRLQVTGVERGRALAQVVSGEVRAGEEARIGAYAFPETRLKVSVAATGREIRESLESALEGEGIDFLPSEDEFAHLMVRRRGSELRIVAADGATRHAVDLSEDLSDERWLREFTGALRMEAAAMRLGELENPAPDFGLDVWMAQEQRRFGIGELVTFHARADRAGYLTLVDLGTDGTVTVLYPNAFESTKRVEAGEQVTFPSEAMGFEIVAEDPPGRGMVRAFLTPEPLEIPQDGDFTSGGMLLADRIAQALRRAMGASDPGAPIPLGDWASASLIYEIVP